ncbi:MAG TPA: hypothetical protein VIM16_03110 [Mucilaginibacter sp.]|jgi:hypothetical protein
MMKCVPFTSWISYNNILYIGDEAKECMEIIEKFNARLLEIEKHHAGWFSDGGGKYITQNKLQRHIQYHFEGGIAIFKFRNEDELPGSIRRECLMACRNLAFEQLFYAS